METPEYYKSHGVQPVDIIDLLHMDFYAGNILKYLMRAGRKGITHDSTGRQIIEAANADLRKAAHYCQLAKAVCFAMPAASTIGEHKGNRDAIQQAINLLDIYFDDRDGQHQLHSICKWLVEGNPYLLVGAAIEKLVR